MGEEDAFFLSGKPVIKMDFKLHSEYTPAGDQPKAIDELVNGVESGMKEQTLLGGKNLHDGERHREAQPPYARFCA